jgi:hypothetical protein
MSSLDPTAVRAVPFLLTEIFHDSDFLRTDALKAAATFQTSSVDFHDCIGVSMRCVSDRIGAGGSKDNSQQKIDV